MRFPILLAALLLTVSSAAAADAGGSCGFRPDDWCPSPPGDPCGRHLNEADCKADPACYAMPYRGESVVACIVDERGFATNCPAVGCTSTPPDKGLRRLGLQ
jgi:hypothetical protein